MPYLSASAVVIHYEGVISSVCTFSFTLLVCLAFRLFAPKQETTDHDRCGRYCGITA